MSTHPPTLTTAELIEQCERATGVRFSVHQLGDYVEAGLIPPSTRGKGKGARMGGSWPRRWPPDCLPRLVLIAQSRERKYVSIDRAALFLMLKGFPPLKAQPVRNVLNAYLDDEERQFSSNRTYLKKKHISDSDKRRRFDEGMIRRNPQLDLSNRELRESFLSMVAAMGGLADLNERDLPSKIGRYLTPHALSETLTKLDDTAVLTACIEGMSLVAWFNPMIFAVAQVLIPTPPAATEEARMTGAEGTARLVSPYTTRLSTASLSFDAMDEMRLQMVLFQIAVRAHPHEFGRAVSEHQAETLNMFERAGILAKLGAEEGSAGSVEGAGDQEPAGR